MTNEEKMIYAAAFGAEYARLGAMDVLDVAAITERARAAAANAVRSFRRITLPDWEGDWREDKTMILAMQGRES